MPSYHPATLTDKFIVLQQFPKAVCHLVGKDDKGWVYVVKKTRDADDIICGGPTARLAWKFACRKLSQEKKNAQGKS